MSDRKKPRTARAQPAETFSHVIRVSPSVFKAMTSTTPTKASENFVKAYRESVERSK